MFLRLKGQLRVRNYVLFLLLWGLGFVPAGFAAHTAPPARPLRQVQSYIASSWGALTRSPGKCSTLVDPKVTAPAVLYFPAEFPVPSAISALRKTCRVQIKHLPILIHGPGELDPGKVNPPGLLYLPNKYVVPGGRFNEMYGWDSYFIILGLIRNGHLDLARGIVENFFFEIEHYGTVLNANRTYYLTRSQPPFLTSMILAVYEAENARGRDDRDWLARAYAYAARDYQLWTRAPHLAGTTGLSRYYDFGSGPAPESLHGEPGYYRQVAAYFISHPELERRYLLMSPVISPVMSPAARDSAIGPQFAVDVCNAPAAKAAKLALKNECASAGVVSLTADYYKGDRAMRESGFDISFRFGPYGAATQHYAPVGLNSLLYKTEKDLQRICELLNDQTNAVKWKQRAEARKQKINEYLWDGKRGMFFDYDLEQKQQSSYAYATTFYPLWAGLATAQQAEAVARNLNVFEQPGGLAMSHMNTGVQWDYPYGWAPVQLLAVEGLRRYGYKADADRLSTEFLSMVIKNFRRDGTIREKYNVVTRSSEAIVKAGYKSNVIGFGWTNGVFLELLHALPKNVVDGLNNGSKVMTTAP